MAARGLLVLVALAQLIDYSTDAGIAVMWMTTSPPGSQLWTLGACSFGFLGLSVIATWIIIIFVFRLDDFEIRRRELYLLPVLAPLNLHLVYFGLLIASASESDRTRWQKYGVMDNPHFWFMMLKAIEAGVESFPLSVLTALALATGEAEGQFEVCSLSYSVLSLSYGLAAFAWQSLTHACRNAYRRPELFHVWPLLFTFALVDCASTIAVIADYLAFLIEEDNFWWWCPLVSFVLMKFSLHTANTVLLPADRRTYDHSLYLFLLPVMLLLCPPAWLLDPLIAFGGIKTFDHNLAAAHRAGLLALQIILLATQWSIRRLCILLVCVFVHSALTSDVYKHFGKDNEMGLSDSYFRKNDPSLFVKPISALPSIMTLCRAAYKSALPLYKAALQLCKCLCGSSNEEFEQIRLRRQKAQVQSAMKGGISWLGIIKEATGGDCVVSFPRRHVCGCAALSTQSAEGALSVACCFPEGTPVFGRHATHDICGTPLDGHHCYCYLIYGSTMSCGCQWFAEWMQNVERAVGRRQRLIVYFLEGQVNTGIVGWAELPTSDLWNGVGLEDMQKVELAWLRRQGIDFIARDVTDFMRDAFITQWSEGEYHYTQLLPAQFSKNEVALGFAEAGEAILLQSSSDSKVALLTKEVLQRGLQTLHDCVGTDTVPAVVVDAARVFLTDGIGEECLKLALQKFMPGQSDIPANVGPDLLGQRSFDITSLTPQDPFGQNEDPVESTNQKKEKQKKELTALSLHGLLRQTSWTDSSHNLSQSFTKETVFLSHSYDDPSNKKRKVILQHVFMDAFIAGASVSLLLLAIMLIPFGFFLNAAVPDIPPFAPSIAVLVILSLTILWSWLCKAIPCLAPLGPWRLQRNPPSFWLNTLCEDDRRSCNARVALEACESLLVLFSSTYLMKLECVYELACFCHLHGDEANLRIVGLDWWLPLLACTPTVTLSNSELQRLHTFSCRSAMARHPADRVRILRQVRQQWGSEVAFDQFVHESLPNHVLQGKRQFSRQFSHVAKDVFDFMFGD